MILNHLFPSIYYRYRIIIISYWSHSSLNLMPHLIAFPKPQPTQLKLLVIIPCYFFCLGLLLQLSKVFGEEFFLILTSSGCKTCTSPSSWTLFHYRAIVAFFSSTCSILNVQSFFLLASWTTVQVCNSWYLVFPPLR